MARHDIDDAEKGVRAKGGGIRAAQHLDALDVVEHQPHHGVGGHPQQQAGIDRTSIHHHLQVVDDAIVIGMVTGHRAGATLQVEDDEAGHQAEQLGQFAGTRAADGVLVDDRHRPGRVPQGPGQPGDREHGGQFAEIVLLA